VFTVTPLRASPWARGMANPCNLAFGDGVVALAGLVLVAVDGGNVDDAPATESQHAADQGLADLRDRTLKGGRECRKRAAPFFINAKLIGSRWLPPVPPPLTPSRIRVHAGAGVWSAEGPRDGHSQ
jgi:hypothetical protein